MVRYIDDANIFAPLIYPDCGECGGKGRWDEGGNVGDVTCPICEGSGESRAYVDWVEVRKLLTLKNLL